MSSSCNDTVFSSIKPGVIFFVKYGEGWSLWSQPDARDHSQHAIQRLCDDRWYLCVATADIKVWREGRGYDTDRWAYVVCADGAGWVMASHLIGYYGDVNGDNTIIL